MLNTDSPHLTEALVVGGILFHTEKTDDRKNKRYLRTLTFTVTVKLPGGDKFAHKWREMCHSEQSILTHVNRAVDLVVKNREWPVAVVSTYSGSGTWDPYESFHYKFTFRADKPSATLDEDECIRAIGCQEELKTFFQAAIDKGLATGREAHAARKRAELANRILESYSSWAKDKAKKVVRWEQRIAALKAELRAEYKAQAHECLDELSEKGGCGVTFEGAAEGWEPDARSTAAAKAALVKYMKALPLPSGGFRIPSSGSSDGFIKPEDVK